MPNTRITINADIDADGMSGDLVTTGSDSNDSWSAEDVEMVVKALNEERSFTEFINQ